MNLEILPLQQKILSQLSAAATLGNIEEITRLSALAAKTRELETVAARIQAQLDEIRVSLDGHQKTGDVTIADSDDVSDDTIPTFGGRSPNTTIEITIDWNKNGKPFGVEKISEGMGAATMARLMERLCEVMGPQVLETAAKLRVKRGPMISRDPRRDYAYGSNKVYGNRPINGTGYSVLTGTDSVQKKDDVILLLRRLGIVPGSYSVKVVTK